MIANIKILPPNSLFKLVIKSFECQFHIIRIIIFPLGATKTHFDGISSPIHRKRNTLK